MRRRRGFVLGVNIDFSMVQCSSNIYGCSELRAWARPPEDVYGRCNYYYHYYNVTITNAFATTKERRVTRIYPEFTCIILPGSKSW
jgi:hypothetical protein